VIELTRASTSVSPRSCANATPNSPRASASVSVGSCANSARSNASVSIVTAPTAAAERETRRPAEADAEYRFLQDGPQIMRDLSALGRRQRRQQVDIQEAGVRPVKEPDHLGRHMAVVRRGDTEAGERAVALGVPGDVARISHADAKAEPVATARPSWHTTSPTSGSSYSLATRES
jgi:hypothetical protein